MNILYNHVLKYYLSKLNHNIYSQQIEGKHNIFELKFENINLKFNSV